MTQSQDDAVGRAARLLAGALNELQTAGQDVSNAEAIERNRLAIEALGERLEQQLIEERQQRAMLGGQLTNLAGSLDRLVSHLEGMSRLLASMVERLPAAPVSDESSPTADTPPSTTQVPAAPTEPAFRPGGEAIDVAITGVPGFQTLMDVQKALTGLEQVASASVERFQEDESRVQVQLQAPITGSEIATALGRLTGHAFAVEEARPELVSLKLRIVG